MTNATTSVQQKRILKVVGIASFAFVFLVFLIFKGLSLWVEKVFAKSLHANPDRAYTISYEDIAVNTFLDGLILTNVNIKPYQVKSGNTVYVHLDTAQMEGLSLMDLLWYKNLTIRSITFEKPSFEIKINDNKDSAQQSGEEVQLLFSDILHGIDVNSFHIVDGSLLLMEPDLIEPKGEIKKINIQANGINTDAVKVTQMIPFEMNFFDIKLDSVFYQVNKDIYVELEKFSYSLSERKATLTTISLASAKNWIEISEQLPSQKEIIQFEAEEISIEGLQHSENFYTQLDIMADQLHIDGLAMELSKNKNRPASNSAKKPVFQEMLDAIPMVVWIDSIHIAKSKLIYNELAYQKNKPGSIFLNNINGSIAGLTNLPEKKEQLQQLNAHLQAKLFGEASLKFDLQVPYEKKSFTAHVELGKLNLTQLNPILHPLIGIEVKSGELHNLQFKMIGGEYSAENQLIFDYTNLHSKIISETNKKNTFLNAFMEIAVRDDNIPEQKNYSTAIYTYQRNIHKSVFNYLIQSLMEGIKRIVPKRFVRNKIVRKN